MSDPRHDRDLQSNEHAAFETAVSAAYRSPPREEPAPALDAEILAAARRGVHARPRPAVAGRWRRFSALASAAAVMLAVLVSLRVHDSVRKAVPSASKPSSTPVLQKATDSAGAGDAMREAPSQAPRLEERYTPAGKSAAENVAPSAARARSETSPAAPAAAGTATGSATLKAQPGRSLSTEHFATPKNWWAHIRALRRQGRYTEAAASLAAFRQAYPDMPVPADIRTPDARQ